MNINTQPHCTVYQNEVIEDPFTLPQNWQHPVTKTWYYNVWDDDIYTASTRRSIGLYPYSKIDSGPPGPYHDAALGPYVIGATEVTQTMQYTPWPIDKIRQIKIGEMQAQCPQYTANQLALNAKVPEYVRDDQEWLEEQGASLERMEAWQDVADFNTAKPHPLTLKNSYVGGSYTRQGAELTAKNQAATGSSQSAPWDQTEVDNFVAANVPAADDVSDATPPVLPGYKIRQGVSVPGEQVNRVRIWRTIEGEQTVLKLQMRDRKDSRDIYAHFNDAGGYIETHKFEMLPDGVTWAMYSNTASSARVAQDLSIVFSYSVDNTIQEQYFALPVEMPAVVTQKSILLTWDTA